MATMTFEQAMARLEEIVKKLEAGASLDESIALFEEGSKLAAACAKKLDTARQKITQLTAAEEPNDEQA